MFMHVHRIDVNWCLRRTGPSKNYSKASVFLELPDLWLVSILRQPGASNGIGTRPPFASQTRVEHVRSTKAARHLDVAGRSVPFFK